MFPSGRNFTVAFGKATQKAPFDFVKGRLSCVFLKAWLFRAQSGGVGAWQRSIFKRGGESQKEVLGSKGLGQKSIAASFEALGLFSFAGMGCEGNNGEVFVSLAA